MASMGIEPMTLALLATRSDQLGEFEAWFSDSYSC